MARKESDIYAHKRQALAKKLLKDPEYFIRASGSIYRLLPVETDDNGESKYVARLIQEKNSVKIPGRGDTKELAVFYALLHLETMGLMIAEYDTEVDHG